jgi:hypothetical protein
VVSIASVGERNATPRVDDPDEVRERAPEPVELPDHEHVELLLFHAQKQAPLSKDRSLESHQKPPCFVE